MFPPLSFVWSDDLPLTAQTAELAVCAACLTGSMRPRVHGLSRLPWPKTTHPGPGLVGPPGWVQLTVYLATAASSSSTPSPGLSGTLA